MLNKRKRAQKQEKRFASKFGRRPRAGSGSVWSAKGDIRTERFLVENKGTDKPFYRISARVWEKIRREALREGLREPLYQIDIQDLHLVAIDMTSPILQERDRDYKLRGKHVFGGVTYELTREEWREIDKDIRFPYLPCMIVHLTYNDSDTGEEKTTRLLLMKEEDFFKLIPAT